MIEADLQEKEMPTVHVINPQQLPNKKLLFTTQPWIDFNKLRGALKNPSKESSLPKVWVTQKDGLLAYIVGDGNHRIGLACITGNSCEVEIIGKMSPEQFEKLRKQRKIFGFNIIVKEIRSTKIDPNFY